MDSVQYKASMRTRDKHAQTNSEGSYRLCDVLTCRGVMDLGPKGGRQGLQQGGQTAGGSSEHT